MATPQGTPSSQPQPSMLEDRPSGILDTQPNRAPLRSLPEIMLSRHHVAAFAPDPVPDDVLESILKLGLWAPSDFNLQPWRFIVVRDPAQRHLLMRAAADHTVVGEAPVVIIALGLAEAWRRTMDAIFATDALLGELDPDELEDRKQRAEAFMTTQDPAVWLTRQTMVAVTQMVLAAEAYGLGTALVEQFDPDVIRREFDIPDEGEVVVLLALGRAVDVPPPRPARFTVDAVVFRDRFGAPWSP
ncbi:MAG: nitroreductase family protein [Myxococcota bacterium]